jgi:GNAT superfamily N-acetyltransferase
VAELDGAPIGIAHSGVDDDGRRLLWILYLLAAHHGSGAGQALLDAVVDDGPASLWVLEENPRARAFYERNGFRADGERRPTGFDDGGDEIRMLR